MDERMSVGTNLFGWSDTAWHYIDQVGVLLGYLPVLLIIIAFFTRNELRRWLTRNRFPSVIGEVQDALYFDGIVFTVSNADVPRHVIECLKPKRIGLVCTAESRQYADQIKAHMQAQGGSVHDVVQIGNPDDPQESRRAARYLLDGMKQGGCETLAVDVTGGKTPMSLGAFMAAEEAGATTLYVASHFDNTLKQFDMRTAPVVRVSTPSGV